MKILHIGKKGNMERFTKMPDIVKEMEQADLPMNLPVEEYLKVAKDADIIVADAMGTVSSELINEMPNLKMICSEGVGVNFFDLEAAKNKGVYVTNNAGMNANAVAEQTLLLMLGVLKNVAVNDSKVREGLQIETKEGYMANMNLFELSDFSVGLVGMGNIAKSTARLLKAFGVNDIYYYKRSKLSENEENALGVKYKPLDELLSLSDIVSMHLPVTPETINIANDDFFAKMKKGSYFINTARGEVVDSKALVRALESEKLIMAGLDTVDNEPARKDHYLLNLPDDISKKILFAPHIGGITVSSFRRGYEMIWENVLLLIEGKRPNNIVNGL